MQHAFLPSPYSDSVAADVSPHALPSPVPGSPSAHRSLRFHGKNLLGKWCEALAAGLQQTNANSPFSLEIV